MSKSKEAIKQDAEKVAAAFGYNVDSMNLNVINVKDAYCIGFQNGANEQSRELALDFQKYVQDKYVFFDEEGLYVTWLEWKSYEDGAYEDLSTIKRYSLETIFDLYVIQSKEVKS